MTPLHSPAATTTSQSLAEDAHVTAVARRDAEIEIGLGERSEVPDADPFELDPYRVMVVDGVVHTVGGTCVSKRGRRAFGVREMSAVDAARDGLSVCEHCRPLRAGALSRWWHQPAAVGGSGGDWEAWAHSTFDPDDALSFDFDFDRAIVNNPGTSEQLRSAAVWTACGALAARLVTTESDLEAQLRDARMTHTTFDTLTVWDDNAKEHLVDYVAGWGRRSRVNAAAEQWLSRVRAAALTLFEAHEQIGATCDVIVLRGPNRGYGYDEPRCVIGPRELRARSLGCVLSNVRDTSAARIGLCAATAEHMAPGVHVEWTPSERPSESRTVTMVGVAAACASWMDDRGCGYGIGAVCSVEDQIRAWQNWADQHRNANATARRPVSTPTLALPTG